MFKNVSDKKTWRLPMKITNLYNTDDDNTYSNTYIIILYNTYIVILIIYVWDIFLHKYKYMHLIYTKLKDI